MDNSHPLLSRYVLPDLPSTDEILPYLRQVEANRWYSNFGPLVTEFERCMKAHFAVSSHLVGAPMVEATTLVTCYHALQIGIELFRLPEKAKVLVPSVTFPACPLAVHHAWAEPVLVDVDAGNWQLTPAIARKAAAAMPIHAVMPVAVYGVPVPGAEWDKFTEDTGIPVIIDAAAAFEAQEVPRKCLVAYSMHATKPFGIGEGGLLACRTRTLIEEARIISNFGTYGRFAMRDGTNGKMSEYHGAVALAQLDRWEAVKKRRKDVFKRYRSTIEKTVPALEFQQGIERAITSTLMLKGPEGQATRALEVLNGKGIYAHRAYLPPLYHHLHFSKLTAISADGKMLPGTASQQEKAALMKNGEAMLRDLFAVPFHAFLEDRDIAYVAAVLKELFA